MSKRNWIAGAGLAALLGAAAPAYAADAAPNSSGDAPATVDEIVVTAQKRSEKLQDVPVAVSVVSGDALANRGSVNLEDAQYMVPTLNFRKSGTTINQSLFLRGVGTSTFSIAGEPSISTVVDGVVYSRAGEAFSDLVDIDRLEVLRGPQGTLFGKNTSAGVINIVTKHPGHELAGEVEAGAFSGNEYKIKGAIDVPIGEIARTRVTAFYGKYDGNITNLAHGGDKVNGYEHYGVRGIAVIDATPDLQLTLIGDYRKSDDDCCAELIGTLPSNAAALALPTPRGDKTRQINQDLITSTLEKSWGLSLQADYKLGDYTVTYIGSTRGYDNTEIRDGDWLPRAYVGFNQLHDFGPQTSDTQTHELRLTSPAEQKFSYVIGLYYSRAHSERIFTRNDIVCTVAPAPVGLLPCTDPSVTVTTPTGTADFGSTFRNFAAFGQGTYHLTDNVRFIFGLRYTEDKLSVFHQRVTTLSGPGINPSFGPFHSSVNNQNWSGRIGAQWDIVPESTAYITYARGYKGPAYNVFYNLTATGTNIVEPETADSYELGLKNTLFDGRLVVNLAAYYAQYHNFQANNPDLVAGVLVTRFTNAGEVSTRGAEADVYWRPMRDLTISGGAAYTIAHVDQFKIPTNGVLTGVIPSGTALAYAPLWKANVNVDYRYRSDLPVDVLFSATGSIQSSQISQSDAVLANRIATRIHGYSLLDLSLGLTDKDDRYRLMFQVKNVFDTSFASAITSGGPGGSYRYIIPREADRYYGVTFRVNF